MSEQTSKEIRSTVTSDGDIQISIVSVPMPTPSENEVLIKVEAAPINPSDLALLTTFAADLDSLTVTGSGDASGRGSWDREKQNHRRNEKSYIPASFGTNNKCFRRVQRLK